MSYSRDFLQRRRAAERVRRRKRAAVAAGAIVIAAGASVSVWRLNSASQVHRVVVVTVAAPRRTRNPSSFKAAPGANSLKKVRATLAKLEAAEEGKATREHALREVPLRRSARSGFDGFAASLPGEVDVAIEPSGANGAVEILGGDEPAHGWSTTKVLVLAALFRARGAAGLTPEEQALATTAITESNNESALSLFGDLENLEGGLVGASNYMDGLLRESGDTETVVATAPPPEGAVTTFGQTEWSPSNALKFFGALLRGCLLPASQTAYILNLMEHIEPGESWGLGAAGFRSVAFKGGWGPESGGYLVRQTGVIDPGTADATFVAIVSFAPNFPSGVEALTRTAQWLHDHMRLAARPQRECGAG